MLQWENRVYLALLAEAHLHDALIPTTDDLADANLKLEWPSFPNGGVEHCSIRESSCVVHSQILRGGQQRSKG